MSGLPYALDACLLTSNRKRFEVERLGTSRPYHGNVSLKETNISVAPQDVEMEDLNFYYASYSRQVVAISICSRAGHAR